MTALILIAWPLMIVATIGLLYWLVVAYRVARMMRSRPTIRRGVELTGPETASESPRGESTDAEPLVSIIVPVHNEQMVIDTCAKSLRNQFYEPLQIIIVLDRCTDGTRTILERHEAEDDRLVLIDNHECPDDWAGKCHAARIGAERADGEFLLFTDADTEFDPELVRAAVVLARRERIDLLSLLSDLRFHYDFERIAQPVASAQLIRMYPIDRVNRRDGGRPFANGQFMLFTREIYERVGGHAAVRDALLEDIAFARCVEQAGGQCGIFLADGMLTCSMYDTLDEFMLGWKRIYIEACKRKPSRLRKNAWRVFGIGIGLPLIQLATFAIGTILAFADTPVLGGAMVVLALIGWMVQMLTAMRIYAIAGAPRLSAFFYPFGCWVVGGIMLAGAADLERGRPIPWAGREYVLEPRY
jgi:glycosyltransferase involved in cell wall biosynthesis